MSIKQLRYEIERSLRSIPSPKHSNGEEWLPSLLAIVSNLKEQCDIHFQTVLPSSIYLVMKDRYGVELDHSIGVFVAKSMLLWSKGEQFDRVSVERLRSLHLTRVYFDRTVSSLTLATEEFIKEICSTCNAPCMTEVLTWATIKLVPFCKILLPSSCIHSQSLEVFVSQLVKAAFVKVRAKELFEIIAEYPESTDALRELHQIALDLDMMTLVGKTLRCILKRRLLHIGASTNQIIEMYVTIIRSLRVLDPSNLLLNYVAHPVRRYLVNRGDTVRCIVSSITDGKDLRGELRAGGTLEYGLDSDDEGDLPDENWYPAKRGPELSSSGGKERDILAILVSIYGSTDMFVAEYRSILADKLLQNMQYRSDQEVATLELLKIRFGEEALHSCEVMMHDLEGSRRVNIAVSEQMRLSAGPCDDGVAIDCILISNYYWPSLQPQLIKLHISLSDLFDRYMGAYAIVRKPRFLQIVPQLGLVQLELDFSDGTIKEFCVAPAQASLILFLSESSSMSLEELARQSNASLEEVRLRMGYWLSRRVVRETCYPGCLPGDIMYEIIENQATYNEDSLNDATPAVEHITENVSLGVNESLTYSSYIHIIRGILSNQDAVSIERIYTMLKMVASSSSGDMRFDMNMVQFKKFLASLVVADTLELIDSASYRLRR